MLALPGSAYLYQGEELGLPEVADIPDELREDPAHKRAGVPGRDGCRVPLPWQADAPAFGFSPSGESWLPQPEVFGELAADRQRGVEGSTLELYREALRLRRELHLGAHGVGDRVAFVEGAPQGVLMVEHGPALVVVNTTDDPVELQALPRGADAEVLLASAPLEGGAIVADSAVWLHRA